MNEPDERDKEIGAELRGDFCGCCGRGRIGSHDHFCARCLPHCLPSGRPAEDRTWFAQHGTDCPNVRPR